MQQPQQHQISFHQQHNSISGRGLTMQPSVHESFPLTMAAGQDFNQSLSLADFGKGEKGKSPASDDDEPSFTEDPNDGHLDNRGKKGMPWHRVKWNDKMVRLLITAVSYIGEDAELGKGLRKKNLNLQKKGKWKSVSKVMAERGHCVSPQQCEDKFNDLNKRYKRLNEILGRGTSCQVVERPELLDMLDYVSEKGKEEVRKILSSKHLFYEEMCSYHNGNRLHLPHDPELQLSMRLALRSRDDQENDDGRRHPRDHNADDHDEEHDDHDEFEDHYALYGDQRALYGTNMPSAKRSKLCQGHGGVVLENPSFPFNCNRPSSSIPPNTQGGDLNQMLLEDEKGSLLQKQQMQECSVRLEQQKLQIQGQMLELEKEKLKWQIFCRKDDQELEKMRMENERMKLENEHLALELKHKEIDAGFKQVP